jgi:hypothetical protein
MKTAVEKFASDVDSGVKEWTQARSEVRSALAHQLKELRKPVACRATFHDAWRNSDVLFRASCALEKARPRDYPPSKFDRIHRGAYGDFCEEIAHER